MRSGSQDPQGRSRQYHCRRSGHNRIESVRVPWIPYQRTYTNGELYAAVTGYRSMSFGQAGVEGVYDDVLGAGPPTAAKPGAT